MQISRQGLDFIQSFESFVPYPYDDLVPAVRGKYREWRGGPVRGTLTIGYGHTDAAAHPLKVRKGVRISERQAVEILAVDLQEVEAAINRLVKVPLAQGQYDALGSFTFNVGAGALASSTLLRKLNRGDYDGARAQFDRWVKSKGKTLRGLVRRRDGEQALWDQAERDIVLPEKEHVDHPAEVDAPQPPKSILQSKTAGAAGVVAAGDGASLVDQVKEAAGKAADLKYYSDSFGLSKIFGTVETLVMSPYFWVSIAVLGACAFIVWDRRRKLIEENV